MEEFKHTIIDTIWGFGWHIILWYIVIGLLFVLGTFLLFQRVTLEYLLYTVLIFFAGKYLFNKIVGE